MQLVRFVIGESSTPLNLPSFSFIYLSPLPFLFSSPFLPLSLVRAKHTEAFIERLFSTRIKNIGIG